MMPEPFDNRDGEIWMNGAFTPWADATVHVLNHGLHYASSVFEGVRAYGGKIFKHREHMERLHRSAALLDFDVPYSVDVLVNATEELIIRNNIVDGYIRPVAFRGSEMMAISAQKTKTQVAIATWAWPNYHKADVLETGLRLKTAGWRRPDPKTEPSESKAAGLYMICTLSKHQAEREGFDDALMLDWRGYLAESTGANMFLVQGGELHTPTPDCFLDGITRRTIIGLAKDRGMTVVERHIKPEELANTQEVFLVGTACEVKPVASIDDYQFAIGDVTKQLIADYSALVRA